MNWLRHLLLNTAAISLLAVANHASANETMLYPKTPAASPDGAKIAFSYAGDIWTASIDGGRATQLTTHERKDDEPVYAPDGKTIAFVSERTGSSQIYTIPVDGGRPAQLTFHTAGYSLEDWSSDGETLLTVAARDHHWRRPNRLFTVSATTRSAENIVVDAYADYGRLSPDGDRILLVREGMEWWRKGYYGARASQIWLYDIEADTFERLVEEDTPCQSPIWKPDGSGFYFVRASSGSGNLWSYEFESKALKQLTVFKNDPVLFPAISRDGKTIVFRHETDLYRFKPTGNESPNKIELHFDADTAHSTVRRTLDDATAMTSTKDGLEFAFAAGGDIWVMDTELKEPVAVTSTAHDEREPLFVDDGKQLLFVREQDGQVDIVSAKPASPDKYWWQNDAFEFTKITDDPATEHNLQRSPDGEHLAYIKNRGDLTVSKLNGKDAKLITSGFGAPDYDFSPDGRWLAWSQEDDDFNDEIWIAPIDGSREPFNVSRHPDDDWAPRWSSNGRILAFLGRRNADEIDVYYVYLKADDNEETSRDRRLEKAIKKLTAARGQKPTAKPVKPDEAKKKTPAKPSSGDKETAPRSDAKTDKPKPASVPKPTDKPELPTVEIDFDELSDRIRRITIADSSEANLFWFGDGKTLAFQSKINGKTGTYSVEIPERLTPKLISSSTGTAAQQLKDAKKVAWLSNNKPGTISSDAKTTSYSFKAPQQYDQHDRYRAAFNVAWRLMRDNWYDPNFNNRNWDAIRRKYADAAGQAPDTAGLEEVVSLMLGELNGSHLGFRAYGSSSSSDWAPETPHLGLRFDPQHSGPGLLVADVIDNGPADKQGARIEPGEAILSIDGTAVDPAIDLTTVLNGRLDRDINLLVKASDGSERTVSIRPISFSTARRLLYPQFEKRTRAQVDKLSDGRFGYLHIEKMDSNSFLDFERELYNAGYNKEGLVIDVRENGGGFTTDHLLTALTQPEHAITVPRGGDRGYPHDRKIYATWSKPIVVLCNQNSFSNAEIFSHAIKTLKRGKLVGVPTAGGVISTGSARVMDVGYLRQPFRGWYVLPTGQDMELNGAVPHHIVWPTPGEMPAGIDRQLEKAVQVLNKDVRRSKKKPQVELTNASQRERPEAE